MTRFDAFLWVTPLWVLGVGYLLFLLLAGWLGVALGRRARARRGQEEGSQLGTVLAAMLGLLGLLLAFTYAQAASRYDQRRQLLVREVNAIGTVWLRTTFLPEPPRAELRDLLRRYVDLRLTSGDPRLNLGQLQARVAASEALQGPMWEASTSPSQKRSPTVLDSLLLNALNEMIDLHTSRVASYQDRLPGEVLGLLAFVSTLALLLMGYSFGLAGQRDLGPIVALALVIAAVTFSIMDLDRPHRGLVRVSQESMRRLSETLHAPR
jgi:hypothetical protein